MLAIDIQGFNDRGRSEEAQPFLRAAMYGLLQQAFVRSGLDWSHCHSEDRGDGIFVVAPPDAPATTLIDPLVEYLRAGLRAYNKFCSSAVKINLRMAVHAGHVYFDEHGVSGNAVTHLFRMLDAAAFKRALAASGADFALVSSDTLYEEIISPGHGLIDPEMYAPIDIKCKETRGRAWLYLPPVCHPFLRHMNGQGRQRRTPGQAPGEGDSRGQTRPRAVPLTRLPIPLSDARVRRSPAPGASGPAQEGPSARDSMSARARLIAASAAEKSRRLASASGNMVQARLRERFQPGHGVQHA